MNSNELISVVVPVYNIEEYIKKCLESLMMQTYKKLEILVINDGSTDKSGRICDELAETDARIRVFHKKNGGLSDARNFGIKKAEGKYICLVDGDDYVESKYVEELHKEMVKSRTDIVVCGYNDWRPKQEILTGEEATVKLLTEQENVDIVAWNKLYRKELFIYNNIWYPVGMKHEDALTTYKILAKARKVAYINKSLYNYITRETSIMGQAKTEERLNSREQAAIEAAKYFSENEKLEQAGEVAILTSKFAFVDAAIRGEIAKKYYEKNQQWIMKHAKKYGNNQYLNNKLWLYLKLATMFGGWPYVAFRKIKH